MPINVVAVVESCLTLSSAARLFHTATPVPPSTRVAVFLFCELFSVSRFVCVTTIDGLETLLAVDAARKRLGRDRDMHSIVERLTAALRG